MPKSAYRRLTNVQRDQIAQLAAKRFGEGLSAGDFCRQRGIHYSTLRHICRQYGINIPKVRGNTTNKSAA